MPERQLALEGALNLRDLGGYPTLDGGSTRWHTIFRSGSLDGLPASSLVALRQLGLRTIIDLRWAGEREEQRGVQDALIEYRGLPLYGDQSPHELIFPSSLGAVYRLDIERQRAPIRAILESLLEPNTLPALIHCAVGKDRTGIISALLLGLANVAPELIVADYALSGPCLADTFAEMRLAASAEDLEQRGFWLDCLPESMWELLDDLAARYQGVAGYIKSLGITDQQIHDLRQLLVSTGSPVSQ